MVRYGAIYIFFGGCASSNRAQGFIFKDGLLGTGWESQPLGAFIEVGQACVPPLGGVSAVVPLWAVPSWEAWERTEASRVVHTMAAGASVGDFFSGGVSLYGRDVGGCEEVGS